MENLNAEAVKKALECCGAVYTESNNCSACPLDSKRNCRYLVHRLALAIINSQEQRIKELTEENERLRASSIDYRNIPYIKAEAKADTVREMQERVLQLFPCDKKFTTISRFTIDQIAKEMLEGNDDNT